MRKNSFLWLILLVLFFLFLLLPCSRAQGGSIDCSPNLVQIGAFFHGTWVNINGTFPSGCRAVVEVVGEDRKEILMKKGRRGPLWMNVAEVHIEGVPNLYLLLWHSETSPAEPSNKMDFRNGKNCGYGQFRQRVQITGSNVDEAEKVRLFEEFVKLKESESLYGLLPNGIDVEPRGDGDHFQGRFWLPSKVYPGDYEVRLLLVKGDEILRGASARIKVAKAGFPAILSTLALRRAVLYGILAVVVAIATGFLMGLIFRGRGGGH